MKNMLLHTGLCMLVLSVILYGCSKEAVVSTTDDQLSSQSKTALSDLTNARTVTTKYVIPRGQHYPVGPHYTDFGDTVLAFSAIFDSSAIYNFTDPSTKYDQNTLYGFADNDSSHLSYSARFGWRWFNNQLQIAAYTFNKGKYTIVQMDTVPLKTASNYKIQIRGDHYLFTVNNDTLSLPRASTTPTGGLYKLLPYFGGDAAAPRRVTIKIKEKF